ncbi:hypothetical protein AOLI_G00303570 [Acnodon oligacanthus]
MIDAALHQSDADYKPRQLAGKSTNQRLCFVVGWTSGAVMSSKRLCCVSQPGRKRGERRARLRALREATAIWKHSALCQMRYPVSARGNYRLRLLWWPLGGMREAL